MVKRNSQWMVQHRLQELDDVKMSHDVAKVVEIIGALFTFCRKRSFDLS